jgi:ribosome recycling factor
METSTMGVVDEAKKEMQASIQHLRDELKNLRTGRANPGLVEGVMVEVYGTQMRLADMANITAPEAQQLLITPYDANNCGAIGKGLEKANLGLTVVTEGNHVRARVPAPDASTRKEMVKVCHRKGEETKVSVRNVRRKFNDHVKEMKVSGEIPEDQMHRLTKEIQTATDNCCKEVDQICEAKEKEITTI